MTRERRNDLLPVSRYRQRRIVLNTDGIEPG